VSANNRFYLITITAVLALLSTLSLGRWQLSRAAQKEAVQAAMDSQSQRAPLGAQELMVLAGLSAPTQGTQALHRVVKLRGVWVTDKTVFLDNRQMNAKPGFYVVTPFLPDGAAKAVLVQRGWVARNFLDRTKLPPITTPPGLIDLTGRIAPLPGKLYELGQADTGAIRQNLDVAQFSAETGLALLPISIVQIDPASDGLLRDWPQVASTADKNYGYAFQWFGLSALISILYVWFQIVKRFKTQHHA
jgi:surfeit locus 1 family protein